MYKILCDGKPLFNPKYPEYTVGSPSLTLETSKAGSLSFSIYPNHPNYNEIQKKLSVITVLENDTVIFKGRVFTDEMNFYKVKKVEVEGCLTYFNDTIVRPYSFAGSVREYLEFLVNEHNSWVLDFQKFKIGKITVEDENEYIVRASSEYPNTWKEIEDKLLKLLGGYLVIRYEDDGNYIDYLSELEYTNTQQIEFGKNLLDLTDKYDTSATYSAMLPVGAEIKYEDGSKTTTTINELPDEMIGDDIVKNGDMIYSMSAVNKYGWIFAPISESKWEDVTDANNLLRKAIAKLTGVGQLFTNTFQLNAINLNYSDSQIASFRVSQNVIIRTKPHGISETIPLTQLKIDILNPQNTKITVGRTVLTLTDNVSQKENNIADRVTSVEKDVASNRDNITNVENEVLTQRSSIINDCRGIVATALEEYSKTGDFGTFKQTLESDITAWAGQLVADFTKTTEAVTTVNGELRAIVEKLEKHFEFTVDGLTIKAGQNAMQILIDNDVISFTKNGQQFGRWDGVDFHTGNIFVNVDEQARFGGFSFVPRSDGSLSLLKMGG